MMLPRKPLGSRNLCNISINHTTVNACRQVDSTFNKFAYRGIDLLPLGTIMDLFTATMIIFLMIFVATAVITLGSLPAWISLPDEYRKPLFRLLIAEVIGCVIIFVAQGITEYYEDKSLTISVASFENGSEWRWDYAGENWATKSWFSRSDQNEVTLNATTYFRSNGHEKNGKALAHWSFDPVQVDGEVSEIVLAGSVQWTPLAIEMYPAKEGIENHRQPISVTLKPTISYRGIWVTEETDQRHKGQFNLLPR